MNRTFESWEVQARLALVKQGLGRQVVDPLVEGARADCEESGQSPWEAVGTPEEFAAAVAAEQPSGTLTGPESRSVYAVLSRSVFAAATVTIVFAIFAAIRDGSFSFPVTTAGLVGSVLLFVTFVVAFGVAPALRDWGHPRLANVGWAATFLLILATATAFVGLPHTEIGKVSALAIIGGALLVIWLMARGKPGDEPEESLDSATTGEPRDADAWFDRLNGMLIGRHDLPPTRAKELVAESRSHFAATAENSPAAEFGSIATYAAELAKHEPIRQPPWWRNPGFLMLAWAGAVPIAGWWTYYWFSVGETAFAAIIGIPATLGCALWALQFRRQHQTKAGQARL